MKIQNKKGVGLNEAFGAVLTVILVAVLVIISIFLFNSLGSAVDTEGVLSSVANESGHLNASGYQLAARQYQDFANPTITVMLNATDNTVVNAANYTVNASGVVKNLTSYALSSAKISYTFLNTVPSSATNASTATITQFTAYPALVGLVGTIVFLGLIIGVLVASFVFGKKGA